MKAVGRPSLAVFAVEDTSVQVTWRGLRPGRLLLTAQGAGEPGDGHHAAVEIEVDGEPGAAVVGGLPSGRRLVIRASGDALGRRVGLHASTLAALPGAELCRVATISDLHLGATAFGHHNTIVEDPTPAVPHPQRCSAAGIDAAVAWGAGHLVVKGDITHHGQVEQWRTYAGLVRRAPIPVDALPGNHDRAFPTPEHGLGPEEAAAAFGLSIAAPVLVRDLPGLRLVLADTTTDHHNRGQVGRIAPHVLDAVAEAPRDVAVLVALHHQLQPHLVPEGWPFGINHHDSVRLLDRLAAEKRPVLVTSGHTHRHRRWDRHGVTATQVGSTKDFPGVWAGYVVHEGGMRQVVHRIGRPDCLTWTDQTRRAAMGTWRWVAPGALGSRCFNLTWTPQGADT